ncbi:MAG: hypothetical protein U5K33_10870 [Halofilum sp. (in: g-proteobacteria)]|nr:hypothetical protein [Halofilum sp. (in: g-proteobacteria)]
MTKWPRGPTRSGAAVEHDRGRRAGLADHDRALSQVALERQRFGARGEGGCRQQQGQQEGEGAHHRCGFRDQ